MPVAQKTDPADSYEAITKSDSANFTGGMARAIYVGGTGDVAVVRKDGTAVTFTAVPAGVILPVQCIRVNSANTSATNMVALR